MKTQAAPRAWRIALVLAVALALFALAGPALYASFAAPAIPRSPAAAYDWPQFGGDARHSSNNTAESAIALANVASLRRIFVVSLPGIADGAPAYLSAAQMPGGAKDLLFVTTKDGKLVALDARTGERIWSQAHGPGNCKVNGGSLPCYTTSSPAIDPSRQYVYSYGLDGYVHKHRVADGQEVTGAGWPALATLKPQDEKGSSALTIATAATGKSYLYVTNGGYPGDRGDYQGHVTAIDLDTGAQRVFNAACSDQAVHFTYAPGSPSCAAVQTAVWARPGVVYDRATDRIYFATGNGDYAPAQHQWGDSVLALHPDGRGADGDPLLAYTPANYEQLDNADADLGSTAPAILPAPPDSQIKHLAVQGGKDGLLRLLDLDVLGGAATAARVGGEVGEVVPVPQGGGILTQPATWTHAGDGAAWIFVANGAGIAGLRLTVGLAGLPALQLRWQNEDGGTSPLVANGVLYYAGGSTIRALNPADGQQLWSDDSLGGIHWESPVVAGGMLYVTDEAGHLTAWAPSTPLGVSYLPMRLLQ